MTNALYCSDSLHVLRGEILSDSIAIFLDPRCNSQATYNVFEILSGKAADAEIEALEDTWHWSERAERAVVEVLVLANTQAAELPRAMRSFISWIGGRAV